MLAFQVAALVPECEIDALIDGAYRGGQSRIMTQSLRKIHNSLCNSQTLIVFVNQVEVKLHKLIILTPKKRKFL